MIGRCLSQGLVLGESGRLLTHCLYISPSKSKVQSEFNCGVIYPIIQLSDLSLASSSAIRLSDCYKFHVNPQRLHLCKIKVPGFANVTDGWKKKSE